MTQLVPSYFTDVENSIHDYTSMFKIQKLAQNAEAKHYNINVDLKRATNTLWPWRIWFGIFSTVSENDSKNAVDNI